MEVSEVGQIGFGHLSETEASKKFDKMIRPFVDVVIDPEKNGGIWTKLNGTKRNEFLWNRNWEFVKSIFSDRIKQP